MCAGFSAGVSVALFQLQQEKSVSYETSRSLEFDKHQANANNPCRFDELA